MKYLPQFFACIFFFLLAFFIVFPLSSPGYILTLDNIPTPKIIWPSITTPSFLFQFIYTAFHLVVPSYVLEKIILFLVFFLSGFGMYLLLKNKNALSSFFGGTFYAINPFVYERVMAGQWRLLLGYGLFPFIVIQILRFFDKPSRKGAVILGVLSSVLISSVIHFSLIFAVFLLIYSLSYFLFHQEKIIPVTKHMLIYMLIVFVLNINWILPTIIGKGAVKTAIDQFSSKDLIAFQSVEDKHLGLIFNLLSGYGFWPEVYNYFVSSKSVNTAWMVFSIAFMALSLIGLYKLLQEKDKSLYPFTFTLLIFFLLALDFAGGVALPSFRNTVLSLYERFSFLRGFREPQKLVSVIMFVYAYMGSWGLTILTARLKKVARLGVVVFAVSLPFFYTPTVLGGFWGQLNPVSYPLNWQKTEDILNTDKNKFLVLFFPWHQYMRFGFAGNRVIANPAPNYFTKPILSSQNYETMPLYTHDTRVEALHVEGLLRIEKEGVNLLGDKVTEKFPWGESLSPINVKYILLSKDDDWRTYRFLDNQPDLKKIYESSEIDVYENTMWVSEEELEKS